MLIKKGGCHIETTIEKYKNYYKMHGYEIVEEDSYELDDMSYKELQALYSEKLGKSSLGVKKADLIEALKEVI